MELKRLEKVGGEGVVLIICTLQATWLGAMLLIVKWILWSPVLVAKVQTPSNKTKADEGKPPVLTLHSREPDDDDRSQA